MYNIKVSIYGQQTKQQVKTQITHLFQNRMAVQYNENIKKYKK
jgi:hypothetical protein